MSHRFLEITWRHEYDPNTGENCTRYAPTQMRMNSTYISIYVTWMYLVFMYIIPFTTLAGFNLKTWLEMRRASGETLTSYMATLQMLFLGFFNQKYRSSVSLYANQ